MESTIEPNVFDQATVMERMDKDKYKTPILSDSDGPDENKPKNVVGTNFSTSTSHIKKT